MQFAARTASINASVRPSLRPPRLSVRFYTRWPSKPSGVRWSDWGPFRWLPKRFKWLFLSEFEGPWVALYPAGEIPQYHLHYEIRRRVGLRLILALLTSLLALIRLGKRLKPSGKLYFFLLGVYKFRVGLWLVSLGLYIFWPRRRRRRKGEGERRRGGKGKRKKKERGRGRKSGEGIKGGKKE